MSAEHDKVVRDVEAERDRQDAKWGEQNHPDGTGEHSTPLMRITYSERPAAHLRERAKMSTDLAARRGLVTWTDILLEEVFEALAEEDPAMLRKELIQVAAVAAQWAEAIDRRGHAEARP